jgi:integrase
MKVPEPKKLPSGNWNIYLRLGGQNISITETTAKKCIQQATLLKAEYKAGARLERRRDKTLTEEIDAYIAARSNTLSPVTIRGYRIIQHNRFKSAQGRVPSTIKPREWQSIVNAEAALCKPKTLKNAWGFIRSVVYEATGKYPQAVKLPAQEPKQYKFLAPDQIKVFVKAIAHTKYSVPALLALSSLRVSEIAALRWENIPPKPEGIQVMGAVVPDENNALVSKKTNKNATSTRVVPIVIPELAEALERERQKYGPVMTISQNSLRYGIAKICRDNKLPELTIHDLRRSYASLAYHLRVPEMIAAKIGGWADLTTMHKVYTQIADADMTKAGADMKAFYQNADDNADAN